MNIPEGYKLVPVLPTDEMKKAYQDNSIAPISCLSRYGYEAMIEAAPEVQARAYDEAKERELFEVFAVEHYLILTRGDIRDYYYPHTHCAWTAWISCAKSRARSAE